LYGQNFRFLQLSEQTDSSETPLSCGKWWSDHVDSIWVLYGYFWEFLA
jgi:hypothetical protein